MARDSGTRVSNASTPIAAIGALIRNTHPHQKWDSIHPPRIGPIGRARKLAAAQIPTALGRSALLNRTVSAVIAMTITPAPASPTSIRAARNSATEVEYAHAADPAPKSPREMSMTFLRPYRSPSSPAG